MRVRKFIVVINIHLLVVNAHTQEVLDLNLANIVHDVLNKIVKKYKTGMSHFGKVWIVANCACSVCARAIVSVGRLWRVECSKWECVVGNTTRD